MAATLYKKSKGAGGEAASRALREAGVGIVDIEDWDRAAEEIRKCEAALVICDPQVFDGDARKVASAIAALNGGAADAPGIAHDAARALSHDLRTPLSAMAGWVHLIETGALDEAGLKRAAGKLRGNIEDQVRTIERYLGTTRQEGNGR